MSVPILHGREVALRPVGESDHPSIDATLRERSRESDLRRYDRSVMSITRAEFDALHRS